MAYKMAFVVGKQCTKNPGNISMNAGVVHFLRHTTSMQVWSMLET
jgi:hypothetical protein